MDPRAKLALLSAVAGGLWVVGMLITATLTVQGFLSDLTPNTGSLAWPLVAAFILLAYGAIGALAVISLAALAAAGLNEVGFFAPWPRMRVRVWSLTLALLASPGLVLAAYQFFPNLRPIVDAALGL